MDNPELYTENNQLQELGVEKFLNFHGEYLKNEIKDKEITLIDIGSGCGRVLTDIFVGKSGLKFSKIVGVDKSEEMVNFSSAKYGSDVMSFQVMDAEGVIPENLKKQQFDIVSSFFCLPYCKDLNTAFQNVQSFLKPNGLFCCIFSQMVPSKEKPQRQPQGLSSAQLTEVTPEVLTRHLNANGLTFVKFINIENDEHEYPNIEAVKRVREASIPKIKFMAENEKQKILEKYMNVMPMEQRGEKFVLALKNYYFIARKSGGN